MNEELENTAYLAGDFISESAVRGAFERRHRTLPTEAAGAGDRSSTELPTTGDEASRHASRPRRLRRWSVAELIARAVARPPTGGVAH